MSHTPENRMAFTLAYRSKLLVYLRRHEVFRVLTYIASFFAFPLLVSFSLIAMALTAPALAAQKAELSVDVTKAGSKIDRNIFGQFAEHLGNGIYEGIWVGPDSRIPNTRGIRNDVLAALKALKVPNVRWPGGCFADECRSMVTGAKVETLPMERTLHVCPEAD